MLLPIANTKRRDKFGTKGIDLYNAIDSTCHRDRQIFTGLRRIGGDLNVF